MRLRHVYFSHVHRAAELHLQRLAQHGQRTEALDLHLLIEVPGGSPLSTHDGY